MKRYDLMLRDPRVLGSMSRLRLVLPTVALAALIMKLLRIRAKDEIEANQTWKGI